MKDRMKEISLDELDEKNQEIAEVIGIEGMFKLLEYFGGTRVYFNKIEEVTKGIRDKRIVNEYTGYNTKDLVQKYKLSEESIRRIVRASKN